MTTMSIPDLRTQFDGRVIAPGDEMYDIARQVMYGGFDLHPAVIVRPSSAAEVAQVVTLARETGLELAIRSGGHSGSAYGGVEGGIVLDLANMRAIDVDAASRTAWAETGLTAAEVTAATGEHGLAIGFGDTGSVGIGGITLGGGVGYLSRAHGLTIDNLLAAEVVTADGTMRTVDAGTDPDLFWAIRGGGGNFGVATRFKYRLHEVPHVYGGMLMLPATAETVAGAIAAAEAAPDEFSAIINVMSAPPMPFIPAEMHGQIIIMILLCYTGDAEVGERVVAPFRGLAKPLVDGAQAMPYLGLFQGGPEGDDDYRPLAITRTTFHNKIDYADAETALRHLNNSDAPMRVAQFRVLGGAISRVAPEATAYAHRDEKIMTNLATFYSGPDDKPVREAWLRDIFADLDQGRTGGYVNFVDGPADNDAARAFPDATYKRLATIKTQYDPENLFRRNVNITPS